MCAYDAITVKNIFCITFCYRPERTDFVRMAGLLDAIIVPFSAVGISDSVTMIFDQKGKI